MQYVCFFSQLKQCNQNKGAIHKIKGTKSKMASKMAAVNLCFWISQLLNIAEQKFEMQYTCFCVQLEQ